MLVEILAQNKLPSAVVSALQSVWFIKVKGCNLFFFFFFFFFFFGVVYTLQNLTFVKYEQAPVSLDTRARLPVTVTFAGNVSGEHALPT